MPEHTPKPLGAAWLRAFAARCGSRALAHIIDISAWVGARIPSRAAHALAGAGGRLQWALRPNRRRQLAFNICRAVGAPSDDARVRRVVRRVMVNEAHTAADLLWSLGKPRELLRTVEYQGWEHVDQAVAAGKGLIFAGTHLGGWEVATAIPGARVPVRTSVIVADDWIAWSVERARVGAGLEVMYPQGAALRSVRRLRAGEAVLVLGDSSDHAGHTHRVKFLGHDVDMPAGVVALARLSGAPIVTFTFLPLGPRRWHAVMDAPIAVSAAGAGRAGEQQVLQELADRWSRAILASIEHWAMARPMRWREPLQDGAAEQKHSR